MAQALMGTYNHTIDAKGRMAFPTKLREQLGDSFVITIDPSGCLFAIPPRNGSFSPKE